MGGVYRQSNRGVLGIKNGAVAGIPFPIYIYICDGKQQNAFEIIPHQMRSKIILSVREHFPKKLEKVSLQQESESPRTGGGFFWGDLFWVLRKIDMWKMASFLAWKKKQIVLHGSESSFNPV